MVRCISRQSNDSPAAGCASWCKVAQSRAHCEWCKCRSCDFCPGTADHPAELVASPEIVLPPRYDCTPVPPQRVAGPLRLTACGPDLYSSDGHPEPILLNGVNMYLEWRMPPLYDAKAIGDVESVRAHLPGANLIRFVGVLWKDSIKESDGLECSTSDVNSGYLRTDCLRAMDTMMEQATEAGLWVILAARAKYAAGYTWPEQPDVWHDTELRTKMLKMWTFLAARYRHLDRVAGYEIMSEPRTKVVSQEYVMEFLQEGCDAIAKGDPRGLCVVGPAPYYKVWNFNEAVLLHRRNILYTFDFFIPWALVTTDSSKSDTSYPSRMRCASVYDTWWTNFCSSPEEMVMIDDTWLTAIIDDIPGRMRREYGVPVYCNQWGAKGEWLAIHGRLKYTAGLLSRFTSRNISSSYWIWRSMQKGGRPLDDQVWGFELVHNNGLEEGLDTEMIQVLADGFSNSLHRTIALLPPSPKRSGSPQADSLSPSTFQSPLQGSSTGSTPNASIVRLDLTNVPISRGRLSRDEVNGFSLGQEILLVVGISSTSALLTLSIIGLCIASRRHAKTRQTHPSTRHVGSRWGMWNQGKVLKYAHLQPNTSMSMKEVSIKEGSHSGLWTNISTNGTRPSGLTSDMEKLAATTRGRRFVRRTGKLMHSVKAQNRSTRSTRPYSTDNEQVQAFDAMHDDGVNTIGLATMGTITRI